MSDLNTHDPHLAERLARWDREQQGDTMTDKNGNTNETPPQAPLPEAPASLNVKVVDPRGFDVMITLRDYTGKDLLVKWRGMSKYLLDNGYTPTNAPRPAAPPQAPPEPTPAEIEAELNPEMAAASQPQAAQAGPPVAGGQSFMADKLTANTTGGSTYWKVRGGRFSKFGVTIWPEVLQAAQQVGLILGGQGEPDPALEYPLNGWIAYYSITDEGKPQKVTLLAQAA